LCKLENPFSAIIWKAIQNFSEIIIVRNIFSERLLKTIGVSEKLKAFPDVTFSLITGPEKDDNANEHRTLDCLIQKLGIFSKPYVIMVLAKPWTDEEIDGRYRNRYEKLCSQLITLCNKCMSEGNKILFLPFFHNNDRDFIKQIEPSLYGEYKVCEENEINLEEKRLLFAGAKACISMRFHGVAFSLYQGIPCEAICYAPKATELMREVGLNDFIVRFGIRADSCFFSEFDMEDHALNAVYCKLWEPESKDRFQRASQILRSRAADGEQKFIETLFGD